MDAFAKRERISQWTVGRNEVNFEQVLKEIRWVSPRNW